MRGWIYSFISACVCCSAWADPGRPDEHTVLTLYDFEKADLTGDAVMQQVRCDLATGRGVTSGAKALQVVYPARPIYKKVSFEPDVAWDVSELGDCCIALDIANLSDASAQLFMSLQDEKQSVTAHVNVGAGKSGTFFYDLAGPNQALNPGITGWPGRQAGEVGGSDGMAVPFQYAWGERVLDLSSLKHIGLYMKGNLTERALVFDNIRIVPNPGGDAADLKALVDEYGQYTGADWPGKAHSDQELGRQGRRESAELERAPPLGDRSKFGGWSAGPELEGTGFFRTAKVDGTWTLVDPEGYLFFASGIANCRLVNCPTLTGRDYEHAASRQGARVASELRRDMFSWLPREDDPLAAHYDYATSVHTGPLEHGQTFNFYAANLQRKYGAEYLTRWRDVTLSRMQHWGFTCFGNWTDAQFYGNERVAYFANAWITGTHHRVSSGSDYWGAIHDPFDPEFVQSVRRTIAQLDAEVQGDPWCIGVFIDNELSWGNQWGDEKRFGLVINTLSRDAASCPAKAAFIEFLKRRHDTMGHLNQAWGVELKSWEGLAAGYRHEGGLTGRKREDFEALSETLASEYFRVVNRELKRVMPDHLYCGSRFADWGLTPEAVQAAARHTDVISYNLYTEGLPGHFGDWLEEIDRPSLLGEFHFGATDRGMFHGGICTASSQKDRGVKYGNYMRSVITHPHFVGAHWFQYIDSPTTGRAVDGENYNSGFVSATDHPHAELIQAARDVNRGLYKLRFRDMKD